MIWQEDTSKFSLQILICVLSRRIFTRGRLLQRNVAKDIQSLCRYLRKMNDVFKELNVLVENGKDALHKLKKDILETVFNNFYKYKQVLISRF